MAKRVFILGAGFSHHLSGGMFPLGKDLLPIIKQMKIKELERHINDTPSGNIEVILTKFDLDQKVTDDQKDKIKRKIFLKLQKNMLIQSVYVNCPDAIANGVNLIKNLFREDDVIITLNYDLLLEHILSLEKVDMWSPYGNGYGKSFPGSVEPKENDKRNNEKRKNIRILKVHGSYNFFNPKLVPGPGMPDFMIAMINDSHKDFYDRKIMFENVAFIGTRVEELSINDKCIVPPTYVKPFANNRTFIKIWHEAWAAMRDVETICIIGYSFPKEDSLMLLLMSVFEMNQRQDGDKVGINILNSAEEYSRIKELLKSVVRANGEYDISWKNFELDQSDSNKPYSDLAEYLSN